MSSSERNRHFEQRVERQADRLRKAERERPGLLAQAVSLGVLGLLFVLPLVGGAYLGRWLDSLATGYSVRWTLSMICLGLVIGAVNVWLHLRD
jgi:ATP synthase protein I